MRARSVIKISLGVIYLLAAATATAETAHAAASEKEWRHPDLKDIQITVPPLVGEVYEAEVPDTLELGNRAALALNGITRMLNPEYSYAQYTYADLRHNPPYMAMEAGITNLNPKWIEALPLLRIMSGSVQNSDIDHLMIEGVFENTGIDGLTYQPPDHPGAFYEDFSREQAQPAANIFGEGRQLLTWAVWTQIDPDNPVYRQVAERKIQRLLEITARKGEGLYFRRTQGYTPGQEDTENLDILAITDHDVKDPSFGMVGTAVAHSVSPVAMGAGRYYRVTGYEPALELARGLANYYRDDGKAIDENGHWHGNHFHIMALGVLGQLEYALAAGDEEMLQWVRRAYEYGRSIGDPTLGFYAGIPACNPCEYNPNAEECGQDQDRLMVEPCSVADMILFALQLTRAGVDDYYEDVEHAVRNYLVETQVTNVDFIKDYPEELSTGVKNLHQAILDDDPRRLNYDDVAERSIGSFCCANPNQWYQGAPGPHLCGCCIGNAGRVLYYAWDSILEDKEDDLWVHMLLNRASPWADLDSYLPYEGKVVVKMKQAKNVNVRIPSWTNHDKVTCSVNGQDRTPEWARGTYLRTEGLQAGDELVVQFPVPEKTLYTNLRGKEFWMTVRGFTVVDLQPHADVTPIFQRDFYRKTKAPMRKVRRLVSNRSIVW